MRKSLLIALAAFAALPAIAQDTGNWIIRGRALHLRSTNNDNTGLGLTISDKTFPEVDFTYFLSPNLAAELVLTYPQSHTINSEAVGADVGTFKHLPPTLTLQYHFTGIQGIRPYVGAGVNYTHLSSISFNANVAALNLSLKTNSYGLAAQIGADVPLGGGWLFNVDLKKVQIGTTLYANGVSQGDFKVDPVLFSVGVGKRF